MIGRVRLAFPLACALASAATGEARAQATFRVHDHLDPREVEETTLLYVNRQLVRTIHLDAGHPDEVVSVTVPDPAGPTYTLCGRITIREPDGGEAVREVDGTGTLTDVADRDFDAIAAADFTLFFLTDITEGREPVEVHVARVRSCAQAVS